MLQGDLEVLVNRAEFIIFMQSCVPLGPGKFHVVVLVGLIMVPRETGQKGMYEIWEGQTQSIMVFLTMANLILLLLSS